MARALRQQVEGGIYHVYARGVDGRDIFGDDAGRRRYLALLARTLRRRRWQCLSYCLMTNHVHLLLETTVANLAAGMQEFHSAYAQRFNRLHGRAGALFQSRYGSTLVTTDEQLVAVVGYIVHNPVKAGLVERAEAWAWGSHAAMVGEVAAPAWLARARLLELLSAWGGGPRERYGEVVEDRRGEGRERGVTVSTSLVNVGEGPKSVGGSAVRNR